MPPPFNKIVLSFPTIDAVKGTIAVVKFVLCYCTQQDFYPKYNQCNWIRKRRAFRLNVELSKKKKLKRKCKWGVLKEKTDKESRIFLVLLKNKGLFLREDGGEKAWLFIFLHIALCSEEWWILIPGTQWPLMMISISVLALALWINVSRVLGISFWVTDAITFVWNSLASHSLLLQL